ncbi:MAG: type I secretion system permease/ATPase [Sphingomonas sp.]
MSQSTIDDSGVTALAGLLAIHRVAVDAGQLRHQLGHQRVINAAELVRLAGSVPGVRAKQRMADWQSLARLPVPLLANGPDGWFLIGLVQGDQVLVQRPGLPVARIDRAALATIWSGEIVLVTTRESAVLAQPRFDFTWFIPQIVKYRRLIGEVLLITLALNLLGLAAPLFFQNIVDRVLVNDTLSTLNVLALGFVGVALWETAFGWLRTRLYAETSQKIDVELGARLFRHLLRLPMGYFEARRVGDTVARVRQVETIREFLTDASLTVLVDPVFTLVFLGVMALYSLKLTLITLVAMAAFTAVAALATGPLRRQVEAKFERGAANNALLVESLSGIQTLKAMAVEPQWQDQWERQLAAYSAANQRVIDTGNTASQTIQLIAKLNMAAILYFGARGVMAHEMTVGGLIAFNMLAQRVSGPVIRMVQLWQQFQQVRLSVDRLGDVLNRRTEPTLASAATPRAMTGAVRFENIRFRYADDGPWTLEDIDLDIAPGSCIGIVGSSGSGKSTLTRLLQRLYAPTAGRVLIDGADVAQLDPAWLRRQIGVVLQENILFNRSIRDNIALANPALPVDAVMAVARLAGAHEFIARLPQGYDTMIEERGANLSGGQRQRIAIARALIGDPRILILDEATSALDAESEEIVQRNLRQIAHGRTVLIIAHRLSAIRQCDRIFTLEQGRIVEAGSHDELLRSGGRYADLHRRQAGYPLGLAS